MNADRENFLPRLLRPPAQSFFLFGPRGTGKSLWARRHFPGAVWIDLLDPETTREFAARPERLRERVQAEPGRKWVVIDEVQKAPQLLDVVHALIEEDPSRRFLLTGSSARKLKRAGVNLLAGRALLESLHPFLAAELGDAFDLSRALETGLLPLVVASSAPRDVLRAYHALYIREEVQLEGLVRSVADFSRFVEAISFSHAAVLNISNVARECAVGRKTVESYVSILEDLLIGFRLPVFTRRARRAAAAHPKFYLFDPGVFRAIRPKGPLDRPEEIAGAALEGLVIQHLRAWNAYRGHKNELCYWRTRAGSEVDAVVYGEDGFWAVEVKHADRVRPEDLRGLRAFRDDFPECKPILVYLGREPLLVDGIRCLPCDAFLRGIRPSRKKIV